MRNFIAILFVILVIQIGQPIKAQNSPSLTRAASVVLSSNTDAITKASIIDGNDTTMWQSDACFPTSYITRLEVNALYWRCNATTTTSSSSPSCTATAGSSNLYGATDGQTGTPAATIAAASGQALLRIALPSPTNLSRVSLRGIFPAAPATAPAAATAWLHLVFASGASLPVIAANASRSYAFLAATGNWAAVVAVVVNATAGFSVQEVAAQQAPCFERATVDLGSAQDLGTIRVRYWPSSSGIASWLLASSDGITYQEVVPGGLDPTRLSALTLQLSPPLKARYIAVKHQVANTDWAKVYVWGIDAWPPPSPPPPSPSPSPCPPSPSPSPSPSPPPPSPPPSSPPPSGAPNWNAYAGTVRAYSYMASVTVSSNAGNPAALANIADGNDNTQWQSDACFPTGFVGRPSMNPLLYLCGGGSATGAPASSCTASPGSSNLNQSTDTSVYTSASIALDAATKMAWFAATVPGGPRPVTRIVVKGWYGAPVSVVLVVRPAGQQAEQRVVVRSVAAPTDNYNWVPFRGQWQDVVAVRLESAAAFMLTEVALQSGGCFEEAVVDMGAPKAVGVLRFRYWSPDAVSTNMSVSADGVNWTLIKGNMDPTQLDAVEIYLPAVIDIRYMRIRHQVKEDADWRKVYVWGIDAYDVYGRWGPPPAAVPHPTSLRAMMGINGIWGWGFNKFSYELHKTARGPDMYSPVASWGRNYHGMNWDVSWPTHSPKYDTMAKTGTDGQWWLDWDKEYSAWKAAGLKVDASFQFTWDVFPPSTWGPNITETAYRLGFAFGSHFGPGRAPPNVSLDAVEVGNEPWIGFNASAYSAILRGFARGVKDADPTFRVLPCALQANNIFAEDNNNGNFIGARIPPDVAPLLDVLNLHIYSWYRPPELGGVQAGVHPEHPGSSMNGLNNMAAWRDTNMPGKPIWVTEWGWDAHLPGETCTTSLCVSQHAQALYAIRGLLVLARKGVEVADWFFYANGDGGSGVFERSGLRGSNSTNFPELPVFTALNATMQLVGSSGFLGVAAERPDLYAYWLGPPRQPPSAATHLIAWQPVAAGEGPSEPSAAASLDLDPGLLGLGSPVPAPTAAWTLSGTGSSPVASLASAVSVAVKTSGGARWTLQVSAIPLVVKLTY